MKTDRYYFEMIGFVLTNTLPTVYITVHFGPDFGSAVGGAIGTVQYLWIRKRITRNK